MKPPDPRVADGMRAQLAVRAERLRTGERPLGWKIAFGSRDALARLSIDRPLVGFMTDAALLEDGAEVAIGRWAAPTLEAEIAVRMAADVRPEAGPEGVRAAIGGLAAAIELNDVDPPPSEVRRILAGNIFHRHVVLGPFDTTRRDGAGVTARVLRDGVEVASTGDPAAATGQVADLVRVAADVLAGCGEALRAGDVVITGAVVPPIRVAPGERLRVELPPLGALEVSFTDGATRPPDPGGR